MPKGLANSLRLLLGLALLIVVVTVSDFSELRLDYEEFVLVPLGLALGALSFIVSLGLFILGVNSATKIKIKKLFEIASSSSFYNLFIPFSGTASRVILVKQNANIRWSSALGLVGQLMALRFVSAFFLAALLFFGVQVWASLPVSLIATYLIFQISTSLWSTRALNKFSELIKIKIHVFDPRKLLQLVVVDLGYVLIHGFSLVVYSMLLPETLGLGQALFLSTVGLLVTIVPITPGSLGVREGSMAFAALVIGFPIETAASIAVLDRIIAILWVIFAYWYSSVLKSR